MMYSIDSIPMTDYGLHVASHKGQAHITAPKSQYYTAFFSEGYQITKRTANVLELSGFILATDLADFQTKTAALYTVFSAIGLRTIELDDTPFNCFSKDGFSIEGVRVFNNSVFAVFKIKLVIV